MTIDRALSGNPFGIDQFSCQHAAERIRSFKPRPVVESWSALPQLSQFIFKVLFVSVCQQINWDFLQQAMADWLLPDPQSQLNRIASVRSSEIENLLSGYPNAERIRSKERAGLLRSTSRSLIHLADTGQLDDLVSRRTLEGSKGFYAQMRKIEAFAQDPLEKKVRVLAHELFRERIVQFGDPQHLRPAVEYHILRLYIRSGRVYPTDDAVRRQLLQAGARTRTRLVKLLRKAVEEAMELTAFYAGLDIATLNYLEWQIGRAVCTPSEPTCETEASVELAEDVRALSPARCVYSSFCRSFNDGAYGWYHEPHFQKAIY